MKGKPRAADRDIADYIRNLPVGRHEIRVEKPFEGIGFGLSPLKIEGSMGIGQYITIIRERVDGL